MWTSYILTTIYCLAKLAFTIFTFYLLMNAESD